MEDYMNNIQKINTTTFRQNKIVDAIIGDEKQEKFFPRLKLKKWENEVNFSVGIIDDEPDLDSVVKEKDEVVEWDKGNIIAKFYSLDNPFPNDYYKPMHNPEDGAFEMNITLKEKPDTNVVNLSIHTKGLKFHYQPFLTEEEKLAMKVKRPLNVEGSYAVYHKNKKDNQYKTGKFLHIYRPQVEDSAGNKVWGELKIDKDEGIMSVTIPQEFIDNAVYPIQHATGATFGYTTEGGSTTDDIDNQVIGGRATGAAGEVTKMSAYVRYLENDDVAKCALYTRTSDTAATLLTNGVTNVTTSGASGLLLKDFTFSTNPTVEAVDYFLLITGDSSNKNAPEIASDSGSSNDGFRKSNVYADGFPSSITGGTSVDELYSVYATYTPSLIEFIISETLSLSETTTNLRTLLFTKLESLSLSENSSVLKFISFVNSEVLSLSENITNARARLFTNSEALSVSETFSGIRTRLFVITNSLSLSETYVFIRGKIFAIADSLGLVETYASLRGLLFNASDSLGLKEILARAKVNVFTIADSLGLIEVKAYVQKKWSNVAKSTVATVTNGVKTAVSVITNRPKS